MKYFNFVAKHWKQILVYPIVLCLLFVASCSFFNFLLVPAKNSSIVEAVMTEAKNEDENIDMIFFGSSRTYRGINSYALSNNLNKNIFNIAYERATFLTNYYLLKELYKTNKPEAVFIEISTASFLRDKGSEDIYAYQTLTGENKTEFAEVAELEYHELSLLDFTNYLDNFSNEKFIQNVKLKFKGEYDICDTVRGGDKIDYHGKGFLGVDKSVNDNKHLSLPLSYGSTEEWEEEKVNTLQFEYLEKIINFCKSHNITVYLYCTPFPYYITNEMLNVFSGFDEYIKENFTSKGIEYIDFAKIKKSLITLNNSCFYDGNHCNLHGANEIAPILANVISDLENNTYNSQNYFYDTFQDMIDDYSEI